jgi:hypothetical protein
VRKAQGQRGRARPHLVDTRTHPHTRTGGPHTS